MPASFDIHLHEKFEGDMSIDSVAKVLDYDHKMAHLKIRKGQVTLNIFVDNIRDLDRIADEVSTLAIAAREAWHLEGSEQ